MASLGLTGAPIRTSFAPATAARGGRRAAHAVVIGSGFGGLAAAVRLGARGYSVTVLEKLDGPGGRAYVHRQDGFTFDAGPTIITAPFLFEELWTLAGRRFADDVELRSLDPFYRIRFDDGTVFDCSADAEAMRAQIGRYSPADVAGYDAFMRESEAVYRVGFEELGHVPFGSWIDMAKILPKMARLGSHRSVYSMVSRHIRDERLRFIFSFHPLFVGGNPFNVTSIYGLISFLERRFGVHCAIGGTGRVVEGLVRLIEGKGGRLRCNAEVTAITHRAGRATGVQLESGEQIAADVVVSNADPAWTYGTLLRDLPRRRWSDRKLGGARYSMSLVVWYFGTRKRYGEVPHHTILVGPRYRELLADIFDRKVLAKDFSLYLHRPTATDASLAPDGCDAFYVLAPVPHLDADVDWTTQAEPYRRMIERHLEATLLPGLSESIVSSRLMTPLDFRDRLRSPKGAAFSFEPVLTQSAWFRPHNRSEELERLYLVGAGTHPGAGLPGVLSSARVLDTVVPDVAALA
jgi:phytoene desaturase